MRAARTAAVMPIVLFWQAELSAEQKQNPAAPEPAGSSQAAAGQKAGKPPQLGAISLHQGLRRHVICSCLSLSRCYIRSVVACAQLPARTSDYYSPALPSGLHMPSGFIALRADTGRQDVHSFQ